MPTLRKPIGLPLALALLIPALARCTALAQDDETVTMLKTRTEEFFNNLVNDTIDPERALNELLVGGPLRNRDDVKRLAEKINTFEATYGTFSEAEAISTKKIGKDLVLLTYLYKMQKYPLVWYLTYYRPTNSDWVVIAVRFDTKLDRLSGANHNPN